MNNKNLTKQLIALQKVIASVMVTQLSVHFVAKYDIIDEISQQPKNVFCGTEYTSLNKKKHFNIHIQFSYCIISLSSLTHLNVTIFSKVIYARDLRIIETKAMIFIFSSVSG